jgi:hypothetical protein
MAGSSTSYGGEVTAPRALTLPATNRQARIGSSRNTLAGSDMGGIVRWEA